MERWIEDIRMAIDLAEQSSSPHTDLLSTSPSDNSESVPTCTEDILFPPFFPCFQHVMNNLTELFQVVFHHIFNVTGYM